MPLENDCFICEGMLSVGKTTLVKSKGIKTFIENSKKREDLKWIRLEGLTSITVHEKCRKCYSKANLKPGSGIPQERFPRRLSMQEHFNFEENCFLCGKKWVTRLNPGSIVTSNDIKYVIMDCANSRADERSLVVKNIISNVTLVDVQARYHHKCYKSFTYIKTGANVGRPKNADLEDEFNIVCDHIEENNDCQFTLQELLNLMTSYAPCHEILIEKLKEKYGDDILILRRRGKDTIVCFRDTQHDILIDSWYKNRASTEEEEEIRIVKAAASIIRRGIRSKCYEDKSYPSSHGFLDNVVDNIPGLLRIFLNNVIQSQGKKADSGNGDEESLDIKKSAIAHAIIAASRPRSFVSTLQLSTGLYVHRKSGSRLIIDLLSKLGLCSSYEKIACYEASAVINSKFVINSDAFCQWVFDNADHNVCTLDGLNTFHSMGGICCITPREAVSTTGEIPKCEKMPSAQVLAARSNIEIVPYTAYNVPGLASIVFEDMWETTLEELTPLPVAYSTILWAKKYCKEIKLPSWRGIMEKLTSTMPYAVSRVICLPFINQSPSDPDTINTALFMAAAQCKERRQKTCFVTFDQPLYIKAREIIAAEKELSNVVVRLGGFHLLMSYLGAIGKIMQGSGIEECWSTVYAKHSAEKMLHGHAFARVVRAHIFTWSALGALITDTVEGYEHCSELFDTLLYNFEENPPILSSINDSAVFQELQQKFISAVDELKRNGPTAQLWLQYFQCVTIVLQFIQAERLDDWKLHLQCIREMLPLFHAAGHLPYAKSAQVYLQDMMNLKNIMDPEEFVKFTDGYFTVRRSDKKWAGIWSDMTIEQTLMRLISLGSGLIHGRGTTPSVLARYILGMPIAFDVMDQLEEFCKIRSVAGEQHVELRGSRIKIDDRDFLKFVNWLREHEPFKDRNHVVSLSTGLVGKEANCHNAIAIGLECMKCIVGKNAKTIKMKRSSIKTLCATKNSVEIEGEHIAVNATLLFQRIAVIMQDDPKIMNEALQYELSPYPLSLFDDQGIMRKGTKSDLYKYFNSQSIENMSRGNAYYVIDGGYLLHKVKWTVSKSYSNLCEIYEKYIRNIYSENVIIIFDGYDAENISVKSYERYRRSNKNVAAELKFTPDMAFNQNKEKFLSNIKNKSRFIKLLISHLQNVGISVKQAEEDADFLIATTALDQCKYHDKVIAVGTDIDLLVLLVALSTDNENLYFWKPRQTQNQRDCLFAISENQADKDIMLFAHAFSGCDTTSSLYRKGKRSMLTLLQQKEDLSDIARTFYESQSSPEIIKKNGEKLMLALYGASDSYTSLNELRCNRFSRTVATAQAAVHLAQLPPTSSSAQQHALRAFYQVQRWLGNDLDPEEWGWNKTESMYLPIMSMTAPAPESLLKMVKCSCSGNCDKRCGCRKAGLKCTRICKKCEEGTCSNLQKVFIDMDESQNLLPEHVNEGEESEGDEGLSEILSEVPVRDTHHYGLNYLLHSNDSTDEDSEDEQSEVVC